MHAVLFAPFVNWTFISVMSMKPNLSDYSAATFDVYGTIINWEPEIAQFLGSWVDAQGLKKTDAELLAMYDRLRQPIQNERPAHRYPQVLKRTLDGTVPPLMRSSPRHIERKVSSRTRKRTKRRGCGESRLT